MSQLQVSLHRAARRVTGLRVLSGAKSGLRQFGQHNGGNVAIMAAILMPASAIAVGAAVVFSGASAGRTSMQAALDSAVLAGVAASDVPAVQISTATNVFNSNLSGYALSSLSGIQPSFTVSDKTLSGQATASMPNPFGKVVGGETLALSVKAAAIRQQDSICVLGLNGMDNGSFDINGSSAQFNADCIVQANSASRSGMTMEGHPTAKAKKFGVTGGHKGDNFSPAPADGSDKIADPYAALPFPYMEDCAGGKGGGMTKIKNNAKLKPGTYCDGIHIFGDNTEVTLEPGIYVMRDGPFWVDASSVVTGDGVMLAFTGKGSTLQIWGNSVVKLTSPTSGTYKNMQFLQDPNDTNTRGLWASIGGSAGGNPSDGGDTGGAAKLSYDGVAYFPTQNFWVFGAAVLEANSATVAIVADKIWTQGHAKVTLSAKDTRNLGLTGPKSTIGARLIN
jgi:Flp pilus assembly protein TadG